MNILFPILMVAIGAIAAALIKPQNNARIKMILTFSGAFLLTAVATEFLPEIYETGDPFMGLYLMLGVFIQIVLEFFSKGAEHGHLHVNKQVSSFPYLLFGSLCLHAFLEGMPLQQSDAMLYGIAIHKLPIAFIFTAFLISSGYKTYQIVGTLFFFGVMSALGTLLAEYFEPLQDLMHPIKAIVAGIVLHVSTTLILESSEGHKFNFTKILLMLAGAALAFFL